VKSFLKGKGESFLKGRVKSFLKGKGESFLKGKGGFKKYSAVMPREKLPSKGQKASLTELRKVHNQPLL